MAFRREALLAVNGCNPIYKKAGDDVDLCWRLQQAGYSITFAPGAFVWHHRRQDIKAYLKQQMGYGDAEAILYHDHPDRFNLRGESKWEGNMYGGSLPGLRIGRPIIYSGVFGAGLFQTIYQPSTSYWPLMPNTLEWHFVALLTLGASPEHPFFLGMFLLMIATSIGVALLRAAQAPLPSRYRSVRARLLIAMLCQIQPLARGWRRYLGRIYPPHNVQSDIRHAGIQPTPTRNRQPLWYQADAVYYDWHWHERDRCALLHALSGAINEQKAKASSTGSDWNLYEDSGWKEWDLAIRCHPWTQVEITTVREAGGLVQMRYRLRITELSLLVNLLGMVALLLGGLAHDWLPTIIGMVVSGGCGLVWWKGTRLGGEVRGILDGIAAELGLTPHHAPSKETKKQAANKRETKKPVAVQGDSHVA